MNDILIDLGAVSTETLGGPGDLYLETVNPVQCFNIETEDCTL